jgi:hypothetical protein
LAHSKAIPFVTVAAIAAAVVAVVAVVVVIGLFCFDREVQHPAADFGPPASDGGHSWG